MYICRKNGKRYPEKVIKATKLGEPVFAFERVGKHLL